MVSSGIVAWLGLAIGLVFGAINNRSNFCTMGAVADIINMRSWARMAQWFLAMATAVVGVALLQAAGLLDISKTLYTGSRLTLGAHLIGGLLFGIGMTLASGCGAKTLVRMGGGDMKSAFVFMMVAIAAYMTLRGIYAVPRVQWIDPLSMSLGRQQDLPSLLSPWLGASAASLFNGIAALFAVAAFWVLSALWRSEGRGEVALGGFGIGLCVVAGWFVTAHLGYVKEDPSTLQEAFLGTNANRPESISFMAPYAYTMELLMFWTDSSRVVTFGIATALGTVLGSFVYALATRNFHLQTFHDTADVLRHVIGANLMGFGGIVALGCTIGQGVSGVSTLALGSFLTTLAIIAGVALTIKVQTWWMMRGT